MAGSTVPSNDPGHAGVVMAILEAESELVCRVSMDQRIQYLFAYVVLGIPPATESRYPLKPMNGEYTPLIAGEKESVTP
jgi:hypothetical protein